MSELEVARRAAVWVTSLHTGGCAACAESVAALEARPYATQLRALGVTFARVPRQSDIILLSGALTTQARASVETLIEGAPRPRALVAIGDCAINGCVFAGSPQLTTPLAQALNVNVELGGCPPSPQAIIDAIAQAQLLLVNETTATPPAHEPTAASEAAITTAPEATGRTPGHAPERATRLAALIEAAGGDWNDDDDEESDAGEHDAADAHDMTDSDHLAGKRDSASAPSTRQSEEKRK